MNIRALAKVLILTTGIFPAWTSTNFSIFLNRNILFLECSENDQTYVPDILTLLGYILRIKIKNKFETEGNIDLFFNGPTFMRNGIIIPMLLIKTILLYKLPEGISFSSRSMNIRALVKVLISSVGLAEYKSKREHLLNKEKCFLFHFESFFVFEISSFNSSDSHDVIKCLDIKHKTHFTEKLGK